MLGAGPGSYSLNNPFANGLPISSVDQSSVFGAGGGGNAPSGGGPTTASTSNATASGGFNPVQTGLGIWEAIAGDKGLKNLEGQPMPNYSLAPQVQDYYNRVAQNQGGYSPAQNTALQQQINQQQNTGYKQGLESAGGNLAQSLSAGFGAQKLNSINQNAFNSANLAQSQLGELGGASNMIQGENNLISGQNIARRNQLEGAYAGALQTGLKNISSGFSLQGLANTASSLAPLAALA